MNGYACRCGWIGTDTINHRTAEPVEFWGDRTPFYGVTLTCPECDSDDLLEIALCMGCEEQEAEPGYDDCVTCLREQAELEAEFRRDTIQETKLLTREGM